MNEVGRAFPENETIQQYMQIIKTRMVFIGKERDNPERQNEFEAERASLFKKCKEKTGKLTYPEIATMNHHQAQNRGDPDDDIQDNENDSDDHEMFF